MWKYIKFDFAEFYPSISVELLKKSVTITIIYCFFAKSLIEIEDKVIIIIKHARKSLLFKTITHELKKGNPLLDVAVES